MDVYFATNRDVVNETPEAAELGNRFNADGPQFFRVGRAEVEQTGADPTGATADFSRRSSPSRAGASRRSFTSSFKGGKMI